MRRKEHSKPKETLLLVEKSDPQVALPLVNLQHLQAPLSLYGCNGGWEQAFDQGCGISVK